MGCLCRPPPTAGPPVTKEASFETQDHPAPELLASLARNEMSGDEESLRIHLGLCRRCMAVYAGFVEQGLNASLRAEMPPQAWVDQALAVPQTTRSSRARGAARRLWLAAAIPAMAAAIVVALFLSKESIHQDTIPPSLKAALASELRADSQGSLLYADDLAPEPRGTRGTPDPDGASSSLDRLLELHRSHPSNPDVAAWLISGYLAANQLRNADPFLREALVRFPDDARFLNLNAILAYKRNSLGEAEADLRKAAARERNATVLVNLAVVRRQEGDESEAQALFKEVLTRFPDSPIQPYVRELASQP